MPRLYFATFIPGQSVSAIWKQFDQHLLERLNPPWVSAELVRFDGNQPGDEVHLRLNLLITKQDWISQITDNQSTAETVSFVDEGKQLPFFLKQWQHRHLIRTVSGGAEIVDDIHYSTGTFITDWLLYPALYAQFWYRQPIYRKAFNLAT
jgi:ligand-binding SRPBCC domain-containing protein